MKFEVFSDMPEKEGKKTIELPKDRKKRKTHWSWDFFFMNALHIKTEP